MIPDRIQTKHDIQKTLAATGLRPDKRFGQHFLIDGNLMRKLLGAAEIVDWRGCSASASPIWTTSPSYTPTC